MSPKIRAAVLFINNNIDRAWHVSDLATSVRLSRSRFCCLFKSEVGLAPTRYLKNVRMEKASRLLERSFLPVKEIGAMVGYNDSTHFMRDFKKASGLTPSQYRKEYFNPPTVRDKST